MDELQIDPDLRYAEIDGRVIFLQLKSEAYHVLDPTASAMWLEVARATPRDEILRSLEQRFAVDASRLAADLDAFLRNCIESGFLCKSDAPADATPSIARPSTSRRLLFFRAWWSLWQTARSLKTKGFYVSYRQCARLPSLLKGAAATDDEALLRRGLAAFSGAENFFTLRSAPQDCLPRSLALFRFMRSLGLAVEHVIGVQAFPFLAHAWVEYAGRVLHDDPANPSRFTCITRIAA